MKSSSVNKGKVKKAMLIVMIVIAALIIGAVLFRLIYREAIRANHAIRTDAGIDLMETVEIGGIKQVLYFRGQNKENPVILYLHGGPGSPEMQLLHGFQYEWENDFTIVHWEQRQAGKTYLANNPSDVAKDTDFARLVEDAWEITQYIKEKLGKDKIIVLGHSWGTVLGTALVQTYPDDFSAYIGVGQIINWRENELIGYNLALQKANEAGNERDVTALESLGAYLTDAYDNTVFERFVKVGNIKSKYGVGNGANDPRLLLLSLSSPYCSFRELSLMFSGEYWDHQGELFRYLFTEYNAADYGIDYGIPVFYVMGEDDYLASRTLAESFMDEIQAPGKQMFIIPGAGHMTMTDNPADFARVLLDEIKSRIPTNNY